MDFCEIFSWKFFLKDEYLLLCRVEISIMSVEVEEKKLSIFQKYKYRKLTLKYELFFNSISLFFLCQKYASKASMYYFYIQIQSLFSNHKSKLFSEIRKEKKKLVKRASP